jgi:hypothetical protein
MPYFKDSLRWGVVKFFDPKTDFQKKMNQNKRKCISENIPPFSKFKNAARHRVAELTNCFSSSSNF